MIKGLAITLPVLGRISIGKIVEKNGKRLPEKDDQFTITTQVQNKDGWIGVSFCVIKMAASVVRMLDISLILTSRFES